MSNIVQIPKIIHQTYKSLELLPTVWKNTPNSWKTNNPKWTYKFWSDQDCRQYVKENFPWFLSTFDNYEYPIQRADAIRYCLLYDQGGLYADCDIECIKPIDDLFYDNKELYLIRTPNNNVITNCIMASKPKSNFWLKVLHEMVNRYNNPSILWIGKHWKVMYTTGPMMLNYMFNKYKEYFSYHILPQDLLLPSCCNICSDKPCSVKNGYTKLLPGCSWVGYDSLIYNWLYCNIYVILIILIILFIAYYIYKKYSK